MENYSIIIFILAIVIGLSAFAEKAKLPYPILLVIVGIAIGFIPTMAEIEINPEIIFISVLLPLPLLPVMPNTVPFGMLTVTSSKSGKSESEN